MVGDSRHLTSGSDWLICVILSMLGHFFGVQSLSFQRSLPGEPPPMAIEWVTLPENTIVPVEQSTAALANIPLQSPTRPDLTANPVSVNTPVNPPPLNSTIPFIPSNPKTPQTSIVPQRTSLPRDIPRNSADPVDPQTIDLPAQPEGLRVSLDNPLIPLPTTSQSPTQPTGTEQWNTEQWDTLDTLPSLPSSLPSGLPSSLPRTPNSPGADSPMDEMSKISDIGEIGEEISVAANPNPLKFRARVEVLSSPTNAYPLNPDSLNPGAYIPPHARYEDLILTADPLTRHCTVPTLAAVQASGTPLTFQVNIDATGNLIKATPLQASPGIDADYQAWAACILQDWPFIPAQVQQTPVAGSVSLSIILQVLPPTSP